MNAVISTEIQQEEVLIKKLSKIPSMEGLELASKVSTKEPYFVGDPDAVYKVAAIDLGVKKNILRCFFATGLFYLHEKFQLSQSSPSHFFFFNKKMAFFIIFVGKIFFLQNFYGFTPVKKILSHLDQK